MSNLLTLFRNLVSVNNTFFADVLPIQYFMKAAASVQGVDYINVDVLKKTSKFNVSLWNRVSSTNAVTVVTTDAHGITVGQTFKALPVTPLGTNTSATLSGTSVYNPGTWTATAVSTNSITFTNSGSAGTTSGTAITINTSTPTYSAPNVSITTASAHGFSVGQRVLVSGITPSGYNGVWTTATGTTGSTLVLPIGSNPGAITVAGFVSAANFVVGTQTPSGTSNISITTSSTHNIVEKQKVVIAGAVPTDYNGTWTAQAGTTGTTLVLNIGYNPGAITTAGTASPVVGTVDLWQGLGTITCAVNEIPSEGTFVAVPTGGIS